MFEPRLTNVQRHAARRRSVQEAATGLQDPGDAAGRSVAGGGIRDALEAHDRRDDDPAGGRVRSMSETLISLLRARADVHPPVRAGVRPAVPGRGRPAAPGAQSQHRSARRAADRGVRALDRADPAQNRRRVPRADDRTPGCALSALPGADPVDGDRPVRAGRRAGPVARRFHDRPAQPAAHRPVDDLPCRYRTGYPVRLWPIRVADAKLIRPPFPRGLSPPRGTAAALRIQLECRGRPKVRRYGPRPLATLS